MPETPFPEIAGNSTDGTPGMHVRAGHSPTGLRLTKRLLSTCSIPPFHGLARDPRGGPSDADRGAWLGVGNEPRHACPRALLATPRTPRAQKPLCLKFPASPDVWPKVASGEGLPVQRRQNPFGPARREGLPSAVVPRRETHRKALQGTSVRRVGTCIRPGRSRAYSAQALPGSPCLDRPLGYGAARRLGADQRRESEGQRDRERGVSISASISGRGMASVRALARPPDRMQRIHAGSGASHDQLASSTAYVDGTHIGAWNETPGLVFSTQLPLDGPVSINALHATDEREG